MANQTSVKTAPASQTRIMLAGAAVVASITIGFFILRSQAATNKPGDLNGDGRVTKADLTIIGQNINRKNASAADGDMDNDGDVDITDLSIATSKAESE